MKRSLLLTIIIFFIAYAFAEELQCCSDKTVNMVHIERPVVKVTDSKRAHGSSQTIRARGVYGGDSMIRPKGKKNKSMASMTRSASLALLHVIIATLVHIFLY
ncbi:unnamed protein product [Arabidopsis lyrata]|nr:unnamed protein product [Arabidopsis lyrata]